MSLSSAFSRLLCCPLSGQNLQQQDDQLVSEDGKHSYPLVDGLPWLLAHPRNSLLDWGAKLNHFQQVLLQEITQLELDRNQSQGAVHDRIECLLLAKKDFLLEITKLMQPLNQAKVASVEIYNALRDRAPASQNLLSYEANIYRDWQWGDEENQQSLELIKKVAPAQLGKLCVLGAGACRLALDVHQHFDTELTVATDINPLFMFAVQKMLRGESFFFTEFPLHPKIVDYVAIKHQMSGFDKVPDDFYLCFADAAKPSFVKHAFDTVLTPWLIDIQPHEFSRFLTQLNQYVPIGGRWINLGSLVFNQNRESLCYSSDEVVELAAAAGFEIEELKQVEMPYLKSPYNAGYRMETVWSWEAVKRQHVEADKDLSSIPVWLIDTGKPIPASQQAVAEQAKAAFLADLYQRIDGETSLRSLARKLAQKEGADAAEFEAMLVQFFLERL
ncbi:hypothetical protein [Agaribacterium haliotis]|uniref:hypothetical protein n=1 Tax=Agaribacterium haliotis TaxID=2013869 RepID=UPI000BB56FAD|nr:hypothetical protein [Agaribacterium haliotis]